MSEETQVEDVVEEQVDEQVTEQTEGSEAPANEEEALAALQEMIASQTPEEYPDDEPETDESDESGEEAEADGDEPEAEAAVAEGPSEAAKAAAIAAGVPEWIVNSAPDDSALQALFQQPQGEAPEDEDAEQPADDSPESFFAEYVDKPLVELEFSEDEFDEDDPVAKKLKQMAEAINEETKRNRQTNADVYRFLKAQEARAKAEKQQEDRKVFEQAAQPFNEFVDSLGSSALGKTDTLTAAQLQARRKAWEAYEKLGAYQYLNDRSQLDRRVRLALEAEYPDIVEKHREVQQKAKQQSKRRTGGNGQAKPVPPPQSEREKMRALERHLRDGAPLPIG